MKIVTFDTQKGIYNFCLDELNSDLHAHPTVEIILASQGQFSIETKDEVLTKIDLVIIDSNVKHRVSSKDCELRLLMLESHNNLLFDFIQQFDFKEKNGLFTAETEIDKTKMFEQILAFAVENDLQKTEDDRVEACLQLFQAENLEYLEMLQILKSKVFLSESRLSHIFKKEVGVSLKKYLVWSRLKKVVDLMLNEERSLLEAGNAVGFYDQAHLSKSFKNILGISPSKAYNSRTIQV